MKTWSTSKKILKARNAFYKKSGINLSVYIFKIFPIVMLGFVILATTDMKSLHEDGLYSSLLSMVIWMSLIGFLFVAIIPTKINKKMTAISKGNPNLAVSFSHFPITKIDCLKFSFIEWIKFSIIPFLGVIYLCIATMIFDYLEIVKGEIGFMTLLLCISFALSEFMSIGLINTSEKAYKNATIIIYSFYILMLIFGAFLYNISVVSKFINKFEFVAGPIGIVIIILVIPVMYIITKVFVFDRKGKEAWFYEKV